MMGSVTGSVMSATRARIPLKTLALAGIVLSQCGCGFFEEVACGLLGGVYYDSITTYFYSIDSKGTIVSIRSETEDDVCYAPGDEPPTAVYEHIGCALDDTSCLSSRDAKPSSMGGASDSGGSTPPGDDLARHIRVNGKDLSPEEVALLAKAEQPRHQHLRNGAYWYDSASGLYGPWKGPAMGILAAGLKIGNPLDARASAGGTGVFVNGRELHPFEAASIREVMPLGAGRYWLDARGNAGHEGSSKVEFNALVIAQGALRPLAK